MAGTIAARVAMGAVCDWVGPRLGMSVVLCLSAPCVFGMALADKAIDFIMLRFGIGFGLSTFVACQFWTACMFNVKIVGAPLLTCSPMHADCLYLSGLHANIATLSNLSYLLSHPWLVFLLETKCQRVLHMCRYC